MGLLASATTPPFWDVPPVVPCGGIGGESKRSDLIFLCKIK
jgi:hypothetical protein